MMRVRVHDRGALHARFALSLATVVATFGGCGSAVRSYPSSVATPPLLTTADTAVETTQAATTSTSVQPRLNDLVLRGDGLGLFPFGTLQEAVVATLTSMLGIPGADSGPPWAMTTPGLNGCANTADTAMMFATSTEAPGLMLIVGFRDQGNGPLFSDWTVVQNGSPFDPIAVGALATVEGLTAGDTLGHAAAIYGEAFHRQTASGGWEWMRGLIPNAVVDSGGGQIVLTPAMAALTAAA
jgi:hypothetical protein